MQKLFLEKSSSSSVIFFDFSHGLCESCEEKLFGNEEWYKKQKK